MEADERLVNTFVTIVRTVLRGLGGMLALIASKFTFLALMFRMEGWDECKEVIQVDIVLGFALASAFALLVAPYRLRDSAKWWLLTAGGAALVWVCVSGLLVMSHLEQHRIRSGH